jgi:DNA-binding Lrp family transcriptional regulator
MTCFKKPALRRPTRHFMALQMRIIEHKKNKYKEFLLKFAGPGGDFLDSVDIKLLKMLSDSSRTPLREMAKRVGLSISGVRKRIKQLERSGVIKKYSVVIDPAKVGQGMIAFIQVDVDPQFMQTFVRSLSQCHNVCELHGTAGPHSLLIKVRGKDLESINKFAETHLRSEFIRSVQTTLTMETFKETILNL